MRLFDLCETVRRATQPLAIAVLASALVAGGCSGPAHPPTAKVHGKVTYKGEAVAAGRISFVPTTLDGGTSRPASGGIQADGSYTLSSFAEGDGVSPGDYIVTIDPRSGVLSDEEVGKPVASTIPATYLNAEQSPLKATIPADSKGDIELNFELED